MFDKLRQKFILINMGLLTIVFIAIFGTIFIMTSITMERDLEISLNDLISGPSQHKPKPKPNYNGIVIELNENKEITNIMAPLNIEIDEDYLKDIVNKIINSDKLTSKIKFDGNSYAYKKQTTLTGEKIALLDRGHQQIFMNNLLQSFIVVGSISLIVLLFISIYLTNKSIKPIKETFEKQKQFIADASHELKTPLTIIKTNTSLILSDPEDRVKNQIKWINYISSQADRMSELVNEMLSLAKLDVEENRLNLVPINMSKIIESMLLGFDAIIYENQVELETNISKDVFINGDKESIKKLFSILMDNAIKHSNVNGKISVNLELDKNKVKMVVKNTGEGIPVEHIEKIFERFYRVDNSRERKTGGYGLGLSIAKSIVEQHKGKIYAKSNVGCDTTFIVELPYQ